MPYRFYQNLHMNKNWNILFAIIGLTGNFIAFYPGFLSEDSIDQYRQALTHTYSDGHPPAMALLWHYLNYIWQGPQVMLLFQLLLYWTSFYIMTAWINQMRVTGVIFITVLFLLPFVQNYAGYIIKDVQMALSWLLAVTIILNSHYKKRLLTKYEASVCILLLFYGSAVRINALPGVVPLILLWAYFVDIPSTFKRLVYTGLITIAYLICILGINRVVDTQKSYYVTKLYMHDILGIFVQTDKVYFPAAVTDYYKFDLKKLKERYTPATIDQIWLVPENQQVFPPVNQTLDEETYSKWRIAIASYPSSYLKHRWDGFLHFLRVRKRAGIVYYTYYPWIIDNAYGFKHTPNIITKAYLRIQEKSVGAFYMRPWFFATMTLLIICAGLVAYKKHKTIQPGLLISLSALCYLLPQFFIFQVDNDFRYSYWNCWACLISALTLFLDQWRKRQIVTT